jgi:hypothetical protein
MIALFNFKTVFLDVFADILEVGAACLILIRH